MIDPVYKCFTHLLHSGLVCLLVVRNGLDNVLSAPSHRDVIALNLEIQVHQFTDILKNRVFYILGQM